MILMGNPHFIGDLPFAVKVFNVSENNIGAKSGG
jgi:hypothetical protein